MDVEMLRPVADEMLSGITAGEAMLRRLQFHAQAVNRLPEVAGEMLGGLRATPALRHRILVAASRRKAALAPVVRVPVAKRRPAYARFAPAACMALALTVMVGLGYAYGRNQPLAGMPQVGVGTYAAGGGTQAAVPQYRSLFAGEGANPPLIVINDRYYRMLTSPVSVPASLLGPAIAEVQGFTEEPSLAAPVGVISNIAQAGAKVYVINGLSQRTACAVEVDGAMRLFQRVGYASATTLGTEMFEDTLDINGQVEALELSGVGIITNEMDANELIYLLSEFAVYHSSELPEGTQALTIYLKNGLSLQLGVQDDVLGGCGAWACPEFFEMFRQKMETGG